MRQTPFGVWNPEIDPPALTIGRCSNEADAFRRLELRRDVGGEAGEGELQ